MKQHPFASLRQQQLTRWVGLFVLVALVMDLLMPALVSRLQGQSQDSIFLETCSVAGIAAPVDGQDPADNGAARTNHCILCAVGQAWLPPVEIKLEVHKLASTEPLPVVGTSTPAVQRFPWATQPARAPPLLA